MSNSSYDPSAARRHLYARLEQIERDRLREAMFGDNMREIASRLMEISNCLIPSDHLKSHEIVVSREVYEAAKDVLRIGGEKSSSQSAFSVFHSPIVHGTSE